MSTNDDDDRNQENLTKLLAIFEREGERGVTDWLTRDFKFEPDSKDLEDEVQRCVVICNNRIAERTKTPPRMTVGQFHTFLKAQAEKIKKIFDSLSNEYWDPKEVWVSSDEWTDSLTKSTLETVFENNEEVNAMKLGAKVRMKRGIGGSSCDTSGASMQYGLVAANHFVNLTPISPFEGLEKVDEETIQRRKTLATEVCVDWYHNDGRLVCRAYMRPENLEVVEEAEEAGS